MLFASNAITWRGIAELDWGGRWQRAHTQDRKIDRKAQWEHEVNILSLLSPQVGRNKAREKTESCYPGQGGHQNQIFMILFWESSVDEVSWNQVITHYHSKECCELHQE